MYTITVPALPNLQEVKKTNQIMSRNPYKIIVNTLSTLTVVFCGVLQSSADCCSFAIMQKKCKFRAPSLMVPPTKPSR